MLKKFIFALTILHASTVFAQTEKACLAVAETAEASAELMKLGKSEEYVIGILTDPAGDDPKIPRIRQKIITQAQVDIAKYVFTVRPTPTVARASAYQKCMSGGLGHVDWSKHPEANHAR